MCFDELRIARKVAMMPMQRKPSGEQVDMRIKFNPQVRRGDLFVSWKYCKNYPVTP